MVGLVDTWAIGHLPGAVHLAAVGLGSVIFNYLLWAFGFLRMGTTGMIAQAKGRDDVPDQVVNVVRSSALAVFFGVLLFLFLPFSVYLLDLSVRSAESFISVQQMMSQPLMLLVQVLLLWSITHHFYAGIRFLLIDADIGVEKTQAKLGSWLVFLAEAVTILLIIVGVYA